MNIRYPIYEGVYRILTFVRADNYRLVGLPVGEHKVTISLTNLVTK